MKHDDTLILATYWMSAASLLILVEVHIVMPLLRAGARLRARILGTEPESR